MSSRLLRAAKRFKLYEESESDTSEDFPNDTSVHGRQPIDDASHGDALDNDRIFTNERKPILVLDSDDEIKQEIDSASKPNYQDNVNCALDVDGKNVFAFDYREDKQEAEAQEGLSETTSSGDSLAADDDDYVASASPYDVNEHHTPNINGSSGDREAQHSHGRRRRKRLPKRKQRASEEDQDGTDASLGDDDFYLPAGTEACTKLQLPEDYGNINDTYQATDHQIATKSERNRFRASLNVKLQISNREAFANIVDGGTHVNFPTSQPSHPNPVSRKAPRSEGPSAPCLLLSDQIPSEKKKALKDLAANCPDWLQDAWQQFATSHYLPNLHETVDGRLSRFTRRKSDGTEETLEVRNYSVKDITIPQRLINKCHWIIVAKGPTTPGSIIYYEGGRGNVRKNGGWTSYSVFNPRDPGPQDEPMIRNYFELPSQQLSSKVIRVSSAGNTQAGHVNASQGNRHSKNACTLVGPYIPGENDSHDTRAQAESRNYAVGYGPVATSTVENANGPATSLLSHMAMILPEQTLTNDGTPVVHTKSNNNPCEITCLSGFQKDPLETTTKGSQQPSSIQSASCSHNPKSVSQSIDCRE
ncbi:MAG: hypothetical protein Q9160_003816 [Pyrenula sp. 1 TL-2023]